MDIGRAGLMFGKHGECRKRTTVSPVLFSVCWSQAIPSRYGPRTCPVFKEQPIVMSVFGSHKKNTVTPSTIFTLIHREDMTSLFCL